MRRILRMCPAELWDKTKEYSGITKTFFNSYFNGKNIAYAYELEDVIVYNIPKELNDFGKSTAPQSFAYIFDNN